jgi:hypothetical protein
MTGQPSRRQVLRLGLVAAAAASGPLAVAEHAVAAGKPSRLSRTTFTPLVGSTVSMVTPDATYRTVLTSVDDLPHHAAGDPYAFRLLFTASGTGPEQGTYTFRNRSLSQSLFVVPVGAGRHYYEAVVVS